MLEGEVTEILCFSWQMWALGRKNRITNLQLVLLQKLGH